MDATAPATNKSNALDKYRHLAQQRYQQILDTLTPKVGVRWGLAGVTFLLFAVRVWTLHGFYIIAYGLGIYLLNLLIGFLSPRVDPEFAAMDDDDDDAPPLPTQSEQEFKPFIRRLPEFKFWCVLASVIVALTKSKLGRCEFLVATLPLATRCLHLPTVHSQRSYS